LASEPVLLDDLLMVARILPAASGALKRQQIFSLLSHNIRPNNSDVRLVRQSEADSTDDQKDFKNLKLVY
jgi:hypothetical protein